jgi:hypothetical protein
MLSLTPEFIFFIDPNYFIPNILLRVGKATLFYNETYEGFSEQLFYRNKSRLLGKIGC